MSLGDVVLEALELVLVAAVIFIVYRALRLSRALVDRPYRARAVGTAIGALTLVSFVSASTVDSIFGNTPTTVEGVLAEGAVWGFTFAGLLYWIVTNNNVALSADYFNRDALLWRAGGKWVTIGCVLFVWAFASLPPWWVPPQVENSNVLSQVFNVAFSVPVVYAAIVLAITFRRIKDRNIRTYTKWALLSIGLMWATIGASSSGTLAIPLAFAFALAYIYSMNHTVTVLAIRTKALPT
jgi:hypothetical protein